MSVNLALSNYNAQHAYSKMSEFVGAFSRPITSKVTSSEGITDSIKLSSQSLQAYSKNWINQQLDTVISLDEIGEYKPTEQISKEYAEDLAGFAARAGEIFTQNELSLADQLTLQTDGLGHVITVDRYRDDAGNIDSTLRESTALTSDFMRIAARESIINEIKKDSTFLADYQDDPQNALKKYETGLREYMLKFQISLSERKITTEQGEPIYQ